MLLHDLNNGIPYPDSSVGEILARNILMHLEDPIFILSECWRVLKPNGLLEIHTPLVDLNLKAAFRDPSMKHFWSSDTLEHFLPGGWDAHYVGFVGHFERVEEYREDGELRYELWRAVK